MNTLKLALRGLSRNRRRSMVTLLAIAFGFAAIALFAGYTHDVYKGLARQAIHGELLGHLTLSRRGMDREGKLHPERYLFTQEDIQRIEAILKREGHVRLVAPRLALSGLISNGRASTIFIAEGMEPGAMKKLQENSGLSTQQKASGLYAKFFKRLDASRPESIEVSAGLAEMLNLPAGSQAALLANTLTGQANALDVTVDGTFNTGNAGTNDKFAFVQLALARSLLDAEGRADRLTVLLDDVNETGAMRERLQEKLKAFDLKISTWQELSSFYTQVHGMFDMIFGFIFSIVLTVVLMSVANSMGMTVIERTREIGTLRAIGLKQIGVVKLFVVEALLLSLFGCLAGFILTLCVRWGINLAHISYVPPNSVSPVLLLVDLDWKRIALTALMMTGVGMLAALLPARRAAKKPVIDALGHV